MHVCIWTFTMPFATPTTTSYARMYLDIYNAIRNTDNNVLCTYAGTLLPSFDETYLIKPIKTQRQINFLAYQCFSVMSFTRNINDISFNEIRDLIKNA